MLPFGLVFAEAHACCICCRRRRSKWFDGTGKGIAVICMFACDSPSLPLASVTSILRRCCQEAASLRQELAISLDGCPFRSADKSSQHALHFTPVHLAQPPWNENFLQSSPDMSTLWRPTDRQVTTEGCRHSAPPSLDTQNDCAENSDVPYVLPAGIRAAGARGVQLLNTLHPDAGVRPDQLRVCAVLLGIVER